MVTILVIEQKLVGMLSHSVTKENRLSEFIASAHKAVWNIKDYLVVYLNLSLTITSRKTKIKSGKGFYYNNFLSFRCTSYLAHK